VVSEKLREPKMLPTPLGIAVTRDGFGMQLVVREIYRRPAYRSLQTGLLRPVGKRA